MMWQLKKLYNKKKEEPRAETEEWRYWQAKEENFVKNFFLNSLLDRW